MRPVDIVAAVAIVLLITWFFKMALAKDRDKERFEEDDARDFFDEHGYWPDETPGDAERRAAQAAYNERIARAEERD